ncbi:MAG: hypothetical protein ABIP08_01715, partial [Lautropia sp.]
MDRQETLRRQMLKHGGTSVVGIALLQASWMARAFPSRPGEEIVPWLDQPPPNPSAGAVENLRPSEELASWLT